jgi:hypothetical protein
MSTLITVLRHRPIGPLFPQIRKIENLPTLVGGKISFAKVLIGRETKHPRARSQTMPLLHHIR